MEFYLWEESQTIQRQGWLPFHSSIDLPTSQRTNWQNTNGLRSTTAGAGLMASKSSKESTTPRRPATIWTLWQMSPTPQLLKPNITLRLLKNSSLVLINGLKIYHKCNELLKIDKLTLRLFQRLWLIPVSFLLAILMPTLIQRSILTLKTSSIGLSRKGRATSADFFIIFRSRKRDRLRMIGVDGTTTMALLLRLLQPSTLMKKVRL